MVTLTRPWKRGTAAQRSANTVIPAGGEVGIETDTGRIVIADGTKAWADLPGLTRLTEVPPATQQAITSALISNGILQAVSDLTGYTHVWLDQVGNIALGITVQGKVVAQLSLGAASVALTNLDSTITGLLPVTLGDLTGYTWALVDATGQVALGILPDGTFVPSKFTLPAGAVGFTALDTDTQGRITNASPNPVGAGRRQFELALTNIYTRPVVGLIIGGSTTEGTVAYTRNYVQLLERMMVNAYDPLGTTGWTSKVRAWGTGGNGEVLNQGLKKLMPVTTNPRTGTSIYPCSNIQITYQPGTDAFTVTIDGGAPMNVTPDSTGVWQSPALSLAVHTISIASANTSNGTLLDQIHFGVGDTTCGIRLYNGAQAGTASNFWLPGTTEGDSFWTAYTRYNPDFTPISLGPNDINAGNTAATFKANIQAIITKAQSCVTGKKLWIPIVAQQSVQTGWDAFVAAMSQLAAENPTVCTFHNFGSAFGYDAAVANTNAEGIWIGGETTPTHPSVSGHQFAADVLASSMQIPSRLTWPIAA